MLPHLNVPTTEHAGVPNWLLALGLLGFAGLTYANVLRRIGPNLHDQLDQEAARQDEADRKARGY
jgi:hypothetical protein